MFTRNTLALAALAALTANYMGALAAEVLPDAKYAPPPFEKYQVILDRMPFGPLPANFDPNGDNQPTAEEIKTEQELLAEQQQLAKQVRMSCVNISPGGEVMVGFTDLSDKTPKNLYLAVGESRDGWTIKDANYDKEWAKLEKDGVEIKLKLGKGLVSNGSGNSGNAAAPAAAAPAIAPFQTGRPGLSPFSRRGFPMNRSGLNGAATDSPVAQAGTTSVGRSFTERLRERARKVNAEQAARDKENQERILKLAREAAQAEVARQKQEDAANNPPQEERPVNNQEQPPVVPNEPEVADQ